MLSCFLESATTAVSQCVSSWSSKTFPVYWILCKAVWKAHSFVKLWNSCRWVCFSNLHIYGLLPWISFYPINGIVLRRIIWLMSNYRRGRWGAVDTFCILNHCSFISSPNKLKFCHTINQLYIQNIMPKHENNAIQKKMYNQFKKDIFFVECAQFMVHTRHEHEVHLTGE